ncbi:MAG: DUF4102 domain-containing protein [Snodgrassella sp.]|uniref:Arm DNA-binding domain-containing protein n=1 Tax=Snodgrassella sp. TaxID=2815304 RepID=UPI002588E4A8|nr:Arm DNA-binding domain-containing protein [Snodgrassella sp.]MCO6508717.1 DUF4102 domain-containing protein [Snodgrassella sp.]
MYLPPLYLFSYVILSLFLRILWQYNPGKRLTDSKLRNIAPNSNQLTSSSVAGLIFKPSSCTKGTGAWILRYYDKVSKKRTKLTLGHYPKMGIASAEKEAKF